MIVTPHACRMTVAALTAATVFGAPGAAFAASASASARTPAVIYAFRTLDNANGLSFNQLLGINNHGKIAAYYGSGAQGHPNKGYLLRHLTGSQTTGPRTSRMRRRPRSRA